MPWSVRKFGSTLQSRVLQSDGGLQEETKRLVVVDLHSLKRGRSLLNKDISPPKESTTYLYISRNMQNAGKW